MKRKYALSMYLLVCIILAILLLTKTIGTLTSGIIFAIALMVFGGASKGFKRT